MDRKQNHFNCDLGSLSLVGSDGGAVRTQVVLVVLPPPPLGP